MRKAMIGQSDFKKIRQADAYYVDKSHFIEEIIQCPYLTILLTRPRRFGKTLNLSMLYHFLEKRDSDESSLFDELAIKESDIFQAHLSKYPVIFLTFKDIKNKSFDGSLQKIGHLIHDAIQQHRYLLDWNDLSPVASNVFDRIINQTADQYHYESSIQELSKELEKYHGKPVVILTDEYDTPIHAAYINGYYEDMVGFMRNLLSGAYKDNSSLHKGVITGTLRLSKESIFTGLNNLGVFTLLDEEFNTCFGFTPQETKQILDDYHLSSHHDDIHQWYDGYNFGDKTILNPWSVMSFVARKKKVFKPYWINTASMDMIEEVLTPGNQSLRDELYDLINDKTIIKPIYENMLFQDVTDRKSELLWSFLLHSGYLKTIQEVESSFVQKYQLKIPNYEVKTIYSALIDKWIRHHVDLRQLEILLEALKKGDIKLFEQKLQSICLEIMSFHDFAGNPESVYHALVLGMLVWLADDYEIRSNRESGYGRYDMMFRPKDIKKQGIIIEFKVIDRNDDTDKVLNDALNQIEKKQYATELKVVGVIDILNIAVGFCGKDVYLRHSYLGAL